MDDSAAATRAHDDAENEFFSATRAVQCLGHRETIRVVLDFYFMPENFFQIGFYRLADQAKRVGIFHQPGARRNDAGRADAERVWLMFNLRGQLVVKFLDAVQDVAIAEFPLRLDALAKKFPALFVENNAFNLRAAEVYADAKHFSNLPPRARIVQARRGKRLKSLRVIFLRRSTGK